MRVYIVIMDDGTVRDERRMIWHDIAFRLSVM